MPFACTCQPGPAHHLGCPLTPRTIRRCPHTGRLYPAERLRDTLAAVDAAGATK